MEGRGVFSGRARLASAFVALFVAISAVPVLAAENGGEIPPPSNISVESPGPAQVAAAAAAAEAEEEARERELEAPTAQQEQQASEQAYADASVEEARQLLLSSFSDALLDLNADPARFLSDVNLVRSYGEGAGTISDEGNGSLLEAAIPLRVENEEGQLEKVDLDLEQSPSGFDPENPIIDVQIPGSSGQPILLGEQGLAIRPLGTAHPGQELGGQNVFYSDVRQDTDLLVAPIASGVEIFDQLRSSDSPEELTYRLSLPDGARLQVNETGGADILRNDEMIAFVAPPSAADARGAAVPVSLEVRGEDIVVTVPHQGMDFTYPILVDPAIHENYEATWYWGSNLDSLNIPGIWYLSGDVSMTDYMASTQCLPESKLCAPSGRGLYIQAMDGTIPAGRYLQWNYTVPGGTTFIPSIYQEPSATINPFWRNDNSCGIENHPQPHDYSGAFDGSGNWVWGPETNRARWYQYAAMYTKAKGIAFGLSTGANSVNLPCNRDLMAGGVAVRLDDPENPTLVSVTGFPTGWVKDGQSFTVTANIYDPGLGVQNVGLYPRGRPPVFHVDQSSQCPGTKVKPCPYSRSAQFTLSAGQFDQGEKLVDVSGYDPTWAKEGTEGFSNTITRTLLVDRSAPTISLTGSLAQATKENRPESEDPTNWDELSAPIYSLKIQATDGSNASPEEKRSGVKRVELYLDKVPVKMWSLNSCVSSCQINGIYDLQLAPLGTGKHELEVKAFDWLEQPRQRTIEFEYFPATGDKAEYVMERFPLPDGTDPEAPGAKPWPEISVNVANGNVLFEQRDVDVEGPVVDLEVERVYNSLLPEALDSEWGDGWTIAQTPELELTDTGGTPAPDQADVVNASGTIEDQVPVPTTAGQERFDSSLQAVLTKGSDEYELKDESGETAGSVVFDSSGRAQSFVAPGEGDLAEVDYGYEAGELSEIAVEDPTSTSATPSKPPSVPTQGNPAYVGEMPQQPTAADVVRDAEGYLLVVDKTYGIWKFNPSGSLSNWFTKEKTGLQIPNSIAIDGRGNLLVGDAERHQVLVLGSDGSFKFAIGNPGSGPGQFNVPSGIAVDQKGNIWVTDRNGRVQKFNRAGSFLGSYGSKGSGPGQLNEPRGLDVAPNSEVWIADSGNNRIAVFDESGSFLRNQGGFGVGNGLFNRPVAVDFDNRGYGWVIDANNNRVQGLAPDGTYYWKFGTAGSAPGQFDFTVPAGLVANSSGRFWVVDAGNGRIQKWETANYIPDYTPALAASFGAEGSASSSLSRPRDVDRGQNGDLWLADAGKNRIQRFTVANDYVSSTGTLGAGAGLLNRPTALAFTGGGSFWVTDSSNNRIQKFNEKGESLQVVGSAGAGNGQFSSPEGIAIDPEGKIWVSDTKNNRLQVFAANGTFEQVIGGSGSGPGQFAEPMGLDFASNGNVYVADAGNHRIQILTAAGNFVASFASLGASNGQVQRPAYVELDEQGFVWVTDTGNDRIQVFDEEGEYVMKFGQQGAGASEFDLTAPSGLTVDPSGRIWVADPGNARVQKWVSPTYAASELVEAKSEVVDDPAIVVESSEDLITSLEGGEAGVHSYDHSGDDLVAHSGPEGETKYEYDTAGLLTKVELPNGTVATLTYEAVSGRAKTVTVDPAGSDPAKTTYFSYDDDNFKTTVERPGTSAKVDYYYDEVGAVFKMSQAAEPPEVKLSGTLWVDREKEAPIHTGLHNLEVEADSEHGIASIEVVDDDTIVSEKQCQLDLSALGIECRNETDEWVVETQAMAPGIHAVEVLVADHAGGSTSTRFWVNVPYAPPPPEDGLVPPTFGEIKEFRQEYGLDLDLNPVSQEQLLNDRIYDLLAAWANPQTREGEVARYATSNWGVPMRPADVAEMEYRDWYLATNTPRIEEWAAAHHPSSYAGLHVDHASGGQIRVGFTEAVSAQGAVTEMKQQLSGILLAPERISGYQSPVARSQLSLEQLLEDLTDHWTADATLAANMTFAEIDSSVGGIRVGAIDPSAVQSALTARYGATAPILVEADPDPAELLAGTQIGAIYKQGGETVESACTSGFGAVRTIMREGQSHEQQFMLTAGHCAPVGATLYKTQRPRGVGNWSEIGKFAYNGFSGGRHYETDAAAARLDGLEAPRYIFRQGEPARPVRAAGWVHKGDQVCFSGVRSGKVKCGPATGVRVFIPRINDGLNHGRMWAIKFKVRSRPGDSGAPVWDQTTGMSLGLLSGGEPQGSPRKWYSFAAPLIQPRNAPFTKAPGVFAAPGMNGGTPKTYLDLAEAR
jgi:YD repeat-containing protein